MFGKKPIDRTRKAGSAASARASGKPKAARATPMQFDGRDHDMRHDEAFQELKRGVFARIVELVDASQLLRMDLNSGRAHIAGVINDIVIRDNLKLTGAEERHLLNEIADDMLGFGPLERFLTGDNVSDIMVYGTDPIYVEMNGLMQRTDVRFRDAAQLYNVCQRIVSLVGRRVDESQPICDARLKDGSRVNVVVPPISLHGPALTIRRFRKDMITLDQMVEKGTISPSGAEVLRIIAHCRCNVLIIGGTGSGKTTLLNVLTGFIDKRERIVTCEDTAELQLRQPHVVRLETRPPNIEGQGEVTMRDLVRNCLRMRPDRIIVGEVRGPEAFDLLQAMNTGHDGSMGTVHANTPAEAFTRMTALVTMGYSSLSPEIIEKMFANTIDVIVNLQRLRDGSRRVMNIAEVLDFSADGVRLNELITFRMDGEQTGDRITGQHVALNPPVGSLVQQASYYGETRNLLDALAQDGLETAPAGADAV